MPEVTQPKRDGARTHTLVCLIPQPFLLTTSSTALCGVGCESKLAHVYLSFSGTSYLNLISPHMGYSSSLKKSKLPDTKLLDGYLCGLTPSLSKQEYSRETLKITEAKRFHNLY